MIAWGGEGRKVLPTREAHLCLGELLLGISHIDEPEFYGLLGHHVAVEVKLELHGTNPSAYTTVLAQTI